VGDIARARAVRNSQLSYSFSAQIQREKKANCMRLEAALAIESVAPALCRSQHDQHALFRFVTIRILELCELVCYR
jgi:hypothetical protein